MKHRWSPVACLVLYLATSGVLSFVVIIDKPAPHVRHARSAQDGAPEMTKLHIETNILYRYAKTSVASRLANNADNAREISFNVVLPQSAFISAFHIELNGSIYNAYVKEKEAAKKEYSHAVSRGWTAAKVDLSARDSNRFSVSVNVEANAKVTFNLTYEELLTRRLGTYDHVISIDPGQIIPDLSVLVRIEESNTLTTVRVPTLRVANEVDGESPQDEPLAVIERPADNIADIKWSPTPDQQRVLRNDGVQGQLTVQYDVERLGNSSQILVSDGYFVHFYAPMDLEPLKKHIVFVLDVSGSMSGNNIKQLKSAMITVLTDLQEGDHFTIVIFSSEVSVWDPTLPEPIEVDLRRETELNHSFIVAANPESISQAEVYVNSLDASGGTNIHGSLMIGLELVKLGRKVLKLPQVGNVPEPMIVFLTDGEANVGESNNDVIVKEVTQKNKRQTPIFSLAFGRGADKEFLKKLSLKNSAFSRLIYEGSDAAIQLGDFYRQVSSPLLSNVTFVYEPQQVDNSSLTNVHFNTLFRGAELVVAGKLESGSERLRGILTAKSLTGKSRYGFPVPLIINLPEPVNRTAPGFMEKLWAHLNIQQLLDKQTTEEGDDSPSKARALRLALKYSFVTPLTSLVVVKPNETSHVEAEDASVVSADGGRPPLPSYHHHLFSGQIGIPLTLHHRGPASPPGAYGSPRGTLNMAMPQRPPPPPSSSVDQPIHFAPPYDVHGSSLQSVFDDEDAEEESDGLMRIAPPSTSTLPPVLTTPRRLLVRPSRPSTTTSPPPLPPPLWMSSLHWPTSAFNTTHLTVTLNDGTQRTLPIGVNEPDLHVTCDPLRSGPPSSCRHLQYCVLPEFQNDFHIYETTYSCEAGVAESFAGVCCPDSPLDP